MSNTYTGVLPAHGFFGSWPETCAKIQISRYVSAIRLHLPNDEAGILNLKAVELYGRNTEKLSPCSNWKVIQSSQFSEHLPPEGLLHARGCHTTSQVHPWWMVEL